MEALLMLFVIVRMLTNAAEDIHNAAKGRPRRPRLTDRINNWNSSSSGRYGAGPYLADLWHDAWSDARRRREAKRAQRAAAAQPAPGPAPAVPAPAPGPQPATRPSPRPRPAPAPAAVPAAGEQPKLRLVPPPADATRVVHGDGPVVDPRNAGKWTWACRRPGCPGRGFDLPTEQDAIDAADAHCCPDTGTNPAEGVQLSQTTPPAGDNTPTPAPRRCNRQTCIYGQIIGTRPWPGAQGSSSDADQLCDRCGWLSSHFTGQTFDQRLAGPWNTRPVPASGTSGPASSSGPATSPAGGTSQTPAQPAGKEDPMSTASGEITSVAAARSFAEAMLGHNSEVMAEIERGQNSLASRGISGPVINELNSLREYYAQAGGRWQELLKAIAQHERLAEQVRATQGAAKDTSFYTNA